MSTTATLARASALSRLSLRLALFAAASVTTMATHAVVITSNTVIPIPANVDGVYVNLVTGATGTAPVTGWDINPYSASGSLGFFFGGATNPVSGGLQNAAATGYLDLAPGAVVGPAGTYSQNAQAAFTTAFQTVGTHVLGVRFQNESTGAVNYGYVRFAVTGVGGFPSSITGWAYENSGGAITFGAPIPEPATYLMMLGGGLALLGATRRRQKQA